MTVVLTDAIEKRVSRLLASGRYQTVEQVVQAGLKRLEMEGADSGWLESFPPGSLAATYTDERNVEELQLLKGSTLMIEDE